MAQPAPPAAPAADSEEFSLRPVGRAPATSVDVLTTVAWMSRLRADVETAGGILVASCIYEHPSLTALLVRRLGSRCPLDVLVMIDKGMFLARSCFRLRPRLGALRRSRAQVYLCHGAVQRGAFHVKAVCIDRRCLVVGSANLTTKAFAANAETAFRFTGAPVVDVLATLQDARRRGRLWDGAE